MSQYDELPVYRASYDLLLAVFQFTKNLAKVCKYTVGEKLKNEMIDLVVLVYRVIITESNSSLKYAFSPEY